MLIFSNLALNTSNRSQSVIDRVLENLACKPSLQCSVPTECYTILFAKLIWGNIYNIYATKIGSFSESDVNIYIEKVWTIIDWSSTTWASDLSDKIKRESLLAVTLSVLPYGLNAWRKSSTRTSRILLTVLNKSWKQYPWKEQLYGHVTSI